MSKRKKIVIRAAVGVLVLLLALLCIVVITQKAIGVPISQPIDRQLMETLLNDLTSKLTEEDYETMLTACRDWEKNTDGIPHYAGVSPGTLADGRLEPEIYKPVYFALRDRGFKWLVPASMVIVSEPDNGEGVPDKDEAGVKFVYDVVEPDTDSPYREKAEYGICCFYGGDPYEYVDPDNLLNNVPDSAQCINYLEEVYDGLYVYVIYCDPLG